MVSLCLCADKACGCDGEGSWCYHVDGSGCGDRYREEIEKEARKMSHIEKTYTASLTFHEKTEHETERNGIRESRTDYRLAGKLEVTGPPKFVANMVSIAAGDFEDAADDND